MTKLIIGLGNPGREYEGTRHNVGFQTLDALADKWRVHYKTKRKFAAAIAEAKRGEATVVLAKPLTFMNRSGEAVAALRAWYKCEPRQVTVVFDDADLPLGQLRVRGSGSSGGHRGMQSVIDSLGADDVPRVRLGIGRRVGERGDLVDHVLSRFDDDEAKQAEAMVNKAAEAVESLNERGLQSTMNLFNTRTKEAE